MILAFDIVTAYKCYFRSESLLQWLCHNLHINTLKPTQNWHRFADDILKGVFGNKKYPIFTQISLNCVENRQIYNKPALVQIMAWCRKGALPLYQNQRWIALLTHKCATAFIYHIPSNHTGFNKQLLNCVTKHPWPHRNRLAQIKFVITEPDINLPINNYGLF